MNQNAHDDYRRQPELPERKSYVSPAVESQRIASMVAGNVGSLQDPGGGRNPTRSA